MAELQGGDDGHKGKKRGGVRAKKMSTRIDMTPMVDLGFLLVTFFILTTTMSKPKAMQVVMPDKKEKNPENQTKIRASEVTTFLLGSNDRIFYYNGDTSAPKIEVTYFSKVRKFIIDRNKEVLELQQRMGWKAKTAAEYNGVYVLIKPNDESKYENLVNFLDEMKITKIKSYAIIDATIEELAMLPK